MIPFLVLLKVSFSSGGFKRYIEMINIILREESIVLALVLRGIIYISDGLIPGDYKLRVIVSLILFQ